MVRMIGIVTIPLGLIGIVGGIVGFGEGLKIDQFNPWTIISSIWALAFLLQSILVQMVYRRFKGE